jgi:hypothetical protein
MQDSGVLMDEARRVGSRYAEEDLNDPNAFQLLKEGTSPEMRALLDRLNAWAQTAGNYTGLEEESIGHLRSGLGGFLAPELQAMREARLQQVDAELATQQRQQQLQAARSGIRAPFAAAQANNLQRQAVQTRGNIEQDLFIKNADVVQQRREAFANMVNQTEQARFGRKATAEGMYSSNLGAEEDVQRGIETYNKQQGTNRALTKGALGAGYAGTYLGLYGGEQALKDARDNYSLANSQMENYYNSLKSQTEALRRQAQPANVTHNYNYPATGT